MEFDICCIKGEKGKQTPTLENKWTVCSIIITISLQLIQIQSELYVYDVSLPGSVSSSKVPVRKMKRR